jgi:hypothetical protein
MYIYIKMWLHVSALLGHFQAAHSYKWNPLHCAFVNSSSPERLLLLSYCISSYLFCAVSSLCLLVEPLIWLCVSHVDSVDFWEEVIAYVSWYDTDHIENEASDSSSILCVLFVAVKFLASRCLGTAREFLLNRCLAATVGYTYGHTDVWEGFVK